MFGAATIIFEDGKYYAVADCPMCGEETGIEVSAEVANAYADYLDGTIKYIQDIPADKSVREFLKTGYCFNCQSILFNP